MSRVDHVVARRMESKRKQRRRDRFEPVNGYRVAHFALTAPLHKQGSSWWRDKLASLAEARRAKAPARARRSRTAIPLDALEHAIESLREQPRPEGMTRQVHRALTRRSVKIARQQYRAAGA